MHPGASLVVATALLISVTGCADKNLLQAVSERDRLAISSLRVEIDHDQEPALSTPASLVKFNVTQRSKRAFGYGESLSRHDRLAGLTRSKLQKHFEIDPGFLHRVVLETLFELSEGPDGIAVVDRGETTAILVIEVSYVAGPYDLFADLDARILIDGEQAYRRKARSYKWSAETIAADYEQKMAAFVREFVARIWEDLAPGPA